MLLSGTHKKWKVGRSVTVTARDANQPANLSSDLKAPASVESRLPHETVSVTTDTVRSARILIVARPATSRAISATLSDAGYEVHRTPDSNSAVEAARRLRPNVAIVATDLPGTSSPSVARRLRSSQDSLPIIVLGNGGDLPRGKELVCLPDDVAPALLLATVADQIVRHPASGETNVG